MHSPNYLGGDVIWTWCRLLASHPLDGDVYLVSREDFRGVYILLPQVGYVRVLSGKQTIYYCSQNLRFHRRGSWGPSQLPHDHLVWFPKWVPIDRVN